MSPVCFVTERLFPLESIDDWALELSWRARALAQAGTPVVVLWITLADIPAASMERARNYYTALGVELLVKDDLAPFLEPDEPLHRGSTGIAGLVAFPALRKLHEQRQFSRIEIPAERGLAFRVIQAQRAGLAFTDTQVVVVLGHFAAWLRHQQTRLTLNAEEIKQDFMERESVELAEDIVTIQPEKVSFADELGWEAGRIRIRPLPRPMIPAVRDIGPRSVPCFLGDPDEDPGFEQFRFLLERTTAFPRWLYVEESRRERASLQRRKQLEAAARNSRSQVEYLTQPDWETVAALLREKQAIVLLSDTGAGPRLSWLMQQSIPFVFPESLLETIPANLRRRASSLAFSSRDPRTLLAALKSAQTFTNWSGLLSDWQASFPATAEDSPGQVSVIREANPPAAVPPPRVTIAVSHYNLKQLLSETLECLEAQTYPACDVVVVDDGSDDPESWQAWRANKERFPHFSFIELPHRGYWSPRNHAITQCVNPYIIIVDGDNLPRPDMAEVFVKAMLRNPQFAAFTSYIAAFSEDREAALRGEFQALNAPLGGDPVSGYFQNVFGDTNSIFRTEALQAIHGFRENFDCAFGDWELFHRLVGHGHRLGVIPKVLLHYRRRAGGMIRQRTLYREHWEFFRVLDAPARLRFADRRRFNLALHGLALSR
jgi:glycosyltransferase involved in cell wall biosynthesis